MTQTCFSAQFLVYAEVVVCLLLSFALLAPIAKPDSLSIVYTSPQNQTDVVSSGFPSVVFTGLVMNNTLCAHHLSTGGFITESSDSVQVVAGVPETSTLAFLAVALLATFVAARFKLRD